MSGPKGLSVKILMDGTPVDVTNYAMGGKGFLQDRFSMSFYVPTNTRIGVALERLKSEAPFYLEVETDTVRASGLCRSLIRDKDAMPVTLEWIQRIVEGKPFQPTISGERIICQMNPQPSAE